MMTNTEKDIVQRLERMNDMDSAVRRDAIESLTGIRDDRVLYPLIKALQDGDQGIQQAAMDALMAFDDESAIYNVLPLLSDNRVHVRNMARVILGQIGCYGIELFGLHIKDKDEDVRNMIANILGNIKSPEAKNLLIEMLRDPCSNVRSAAAEGLGKIGDPSAVEHLINLLGDEKWVAFFAAGALGMIGDKRAIISLTRLIDSSNGDLQIMAIEALWQIGGEDAVDGLINAMDFIMPEVLNTAVKGIVKLTHGNIEKGIDKFGRDKFFEYLIEAMNNADIDEPDIKIDFIRAFSIIDNPKSSAHILRLISGVELDNPDILQIATDALEKLGDEDTLIGALEGQINTCVWIAIRVLGLLKSSRAVPNLITLFEEVDRDVKIEILFTLGRIGGRDSLRFLIDMLSYEEGHIRGAAANGLGMMAAPDAVDSLLNRLQQEEYSNIVEEIVSALVKIGQGHNIPTLFESLISNLSNKKSYVREMIVKGLGMLGYEKSTEYVKGMLGDESWRVRRACLEVLSHLNAAEIVDILITAASDEKDEVRILVAQLAGMYPEEKSVEILISLLSDRNNRVASIAIEGLVKLKAPRAIPYLIETARRGESSIQKSSIWALGELAAPDAEDILKGACNHQDSGIRDAAIEAYKKLRAMRDVVI